jgi:hypothetical protein
MTLPRLAALCALLVAVDARGRPPPQAERPKIGDAIEWRVPWNSNYLREQQVVGMIKPYSGNRHFRKDLGFVGSDARSRGLEWHVKSENKPLKRIKGKRPFKVRMLQVDPSAIFNKMVSEKKVDMLPFEVAEGEHKGRLAIAVKLRKPKPWFRRLL